MIESADNTRIFEHEQGPAAGGEGQGAVGYDSDACPRPVVDILFTDSFRGGNGTQVRYMEFFMRVRWSWGRFPWRGHGGAMSRSGGWGVGKTSAKPQSILLSVSG